MKERFPHLKPGLRMWLIERLPALRCRTAAIP
jgi:hypothetical protein